MNTIKQRCTWCADDPLLIDYHDNEWGKETTESREFFEYLTLEIFQTGLSWRTVLYKREHMKAVFDNFDFHKVADYDYKKKESLLTDPGIIRNRRKVEATVKNAHICCELENRYGSLNAFFVQLPYDTEGKIKIISKTFNHVGPSVARSFLEASGLIPVTHDENCFLYT